MQTFFELVVLAGATVHTMVPGEAPVVGDLILRDGRIEALVEPGAAPTEARVVDCSGRHLFPGLVDGMVHYEADHAPLYVSAGVTLVRDVGGDAEALALAREGAVELAPTLSSPGLPFMETVRPGRPGIALGGLDELEPEAGQELLNASLAQLEELGADYVLLDSGLGAASYAGILGAARARGLDAWGAVPQGISLAEAIRTGVAGIFYLDRVLPPGVGWDFVQPGAYQGPIASLVEAQVGLVPVLAAIEWRLRAGELDPSPALSGRTGNLWMAEAEGARRALADADLRQRTERVVHKRGAFLQAFIEAGGGALPGSNAPFVPGGEPGAALHQELALWEEAGVPRERILALATREAALALGREERGTLAPGQLADVLVLDADPTADLAHLGEPALVVLGGRVHSRPEMLARRAALEGRMDAEREREAAPLAIEEPLDFEGTPLLSGQIEVRGLARRIPTERISGERFRVVREASGDLVYSGRLVQLGLEGEPVAELSVWQRLREGQLIAFEVRGNLGPKEIECQGRWQEDHLAITRMAEGLELPRKRTRQPCVGLWVSSVTTILALGQFEEQGTVAFLELGEELEPSLRTTLFVVEEDGDHRLKNENTEAVVRYSASGAPQVWYWTEGQNAYEAHLVEEGTFDGPGLGMPASKAVVRATEAGHDPQAEGGADASSAEAEAVGDSASSGAADADDAGDAGDADDAAGAGGSQGGGAPPEEG